MMLKEHDLGVAHALYEESLDIHRRLSDRHRVAYALLGLATLANTQGDLVQAARLQKESLAQLWKLTEQIGVAMCLQSMAETYAMNAQPERAAQLCGTAEALRDSINAPLPPSEQAQRSAIIARVRAHLSEAAFEAA